jgi:hypothetical protein
MQFHLFILLVIFSTNAAAIKLIKCENSDGIIEYSDSPCPSGSKQISETVINSNTNLTVMDAPLPRPKEAKKENKKVIVEQSDETAKCEVINEKLSNAERQFEDELDNFVSCSASLGSTVRDRVESYEQCINPIAADKESLCSNQYDALERSFKTLKTCSQEFKKLKTSHKQFFILSIDEKVYCK